MKEFPKNPFHPREILLEEFLEPAGISQAAFAMQIGWTRARLNELIKGKRGTTADAALDESPSNLGPLSSVTEEKGGVTATAKGELCPAISMLDEFQRKRRVTFRSLDLRALSSNRPEVWCRKSAEIGKEVDQEGDNEGGHATEDGEEGAFGEQGVFNRGQLHFNSGEAFFDVLSPLINAAQSVFPGLVLGSDHDEYYTQSGVVWQGDRSPGQGAGQ